MNIHFIVWNRTMTRYSNIPDDVTLGIEELILCTSALVKSFRLVAYFDAYSHSVNNEINFQEN